jgi:DNA-binding NtrC family response regulator
MTPHIVGESAAIKEVCRLIEQVAPTDASVFIIGESGVGKELVARRIHDLSQRSQHPFVAVNMAALPITLAESTLFGHERGAFTGATEMRPGMCESADRGTLFLDEVGELDLDVQSKLLRFLQDLTFHRVGSTKTRRANVRIVSATNRDTMEMIDAGRFREDLYYRLNVIPIEVPPLRERPEDVPILIEYFLRQSMLRYGKSELELSPRALRALCEFSWPGNIRQLKNVIERMVILSRDTFLDEIDLPNEILQSATASSSVRQATPLRMVNIGGVNVGGVAKISVSPGSESINCTTMEVLERTALREALEKTEGRVVDAAQLLGIGQATAYRKIKRYNIDPTTYRDARVG